MIGRSLTVATLVLCVGLPLAPARAEPAGQPQTDPAPALAGPRLAQAEQPASLVERDFEGKVKRLDEPADEAAARLLDLSPADRAAVGKIIAQRQAIVDRVVVEHFSTLLKLYNATDPEDRRSLFREFMTHMTELRERGRLADELAAILPPEQVQRHRDLVAEYFRAVAQEAGGEGMRGPDAGDGPRARPGAGGGALREEMLKQIGIAVRRSYERTFGQRQKDFEDLIARLNLTPEQDAVVRKLAVDSAQKQALEGRDEREQRRVFFRIMQELTPEQRAVLIEHVQGRRPAPTPG